MELDDEARHLQRGNTVEQDSFFAPGPRDDLEVLELEAASVAAARIGQNVLDAIPDLAMVLNDKRQIVAANEASLGALSMASVAEAMGKRPGEAVHCVHATQGPQGCGTSIACRQCGAAKAILTCLSTQHKVQYECNITAQESDGETSMEFLAKANYVQIDGYPLVLLVLRDISAEKRKEALERLFYHDVLNTVGGMIGLTELLVSDTASDSNGYAHLIHHLAESVGEEITAHRNLVQAEKGTLLVDLSVVNLSDLLYEITEGLSHHPISRGLRMESEVMPDLNLRTDRVLLRRIVGNLTKNALEASRKGSVIRLTAAATPICVEIRVNNPGEIPAHVQSQLFKRSFSTSGDPGRGLGTYSIKLFSERYLAGHVSFSSTREDGTTFTVSLPDLIATGDGELV